MQAEESYVCIYSNRDADVILFCHEGGVDIGDVESKVSQPCSLWLYYTHRLISICVSMLQALFLLRVFLADILYSWSDSDIIQNIWQFLLVTSCHHEYTKFCILISKKTCLWCWGAVLRLSRLIPLCVCVIGNNWRLSIGATSIHSIDVHYPLMYWGLTTPRTSFLCNLTMIWSVKLSPGLAKC